MTYALEPRSADIIKVLLNSKDPVKVSSLTEQFRVSRRSVYYDLDKIDEWLSDHRLPPLIRDRKTGISIEKDGRASIQALLFDDRNTSLRVFSPFERERLIICMMIMSPHPVYVEDLMNWCMVSRNTTVSDIKSAAAFLKKANLTVRYNIKEGHWISGDPIKIRALLCLFYPQFAEYLYSEVFSAKQKEILQEYLLRYKQIEQALHEEYVSGILPSLAALTACIKNWSAESPSKYRVSFTEADTGKITASREYSLLCEAFPELAAEEQIYLTLHLLGSRLQKHPLALREDKMQAKEIAVKLADSFEEIIGVPCRRRDELISSLEAHLRTSLYRYRYGIQLGNPMLENIRTRYEELFQLTKAAFLRIGDETGLYASDSEIAYLTLHFGSFMTQGSAGRAAPLRILIICPNGIGAGNMIRSEVEALVPEAAEIRNIALSEYDRSHSYDLVLSTVAIPGEERMLLVSPILTDIDKVAIMRRCIQRDPASSLQLEKLMLIAQKYIPEERLTEFEQEVSESLLGSGSLEIPGTDFGSGLLDHLPPDHIQILEETAGWEEALRFSCRPLLVDDSVTQAYVEAIIHAQKEEQHYMFLTEGLVLAHSLPEHGVKKIGLSMTVCREPVLFGNGKEAGVILTLAALDQTKHIQILNDVLTLFSDKKFIRQIVSKRTPEDVLELIRKKL